MICTQQHMSLPEIVNASLWDLPAYLGGYKSCVVRYEKRSARVRSSVVTITSDEANLLRNLYQKYKDQGLVITPSLKKPTADHDLSNLRRKNLIYYKNNRVMLSRYAFIAEYTLIPRDLPSCF